MPECDRAISAMQATNTILGGASLNANGFFPTSWKANGNSNPDPGNLYNLGSVGGTTFFEVGTSHTVNTRIPPFVDRQFVGRGKAASEEEL
jgi:hypothetical protein